MHLSFFRRCALIFTALVAGSLFAVHSASAVWDPPDWYEDGAAELRKRGGTCEREVVQTDWGSEERELCRHRIPREVMERFLPNAPVSEERCTGIVPPEAHPFSNKPYFICGIFAYPGTSRRPNLHTLRCGRSGGAEVWRGQTAEQSQQYGPGSPRGAKAFPTLRACLRLSRLERRIAKECGPLLGKKYRACVRRIKSA